MAPSAVVGSSPLNQASTLWGDMPWVSSMRSAPAWRRLARGQPHRSRRAWSISKNDSRLAAASAMAHSTSLRATGSDRPACRLRARSTSPAWPASTAWRRVSSPSWPSEPRPPSGGALICAPGPSTVNG